MLGKLGARLLHVGVFVAVGLPVVCLLGLYGGDQSRERRAGVRQHVHGRPVHRGAVDPVSTLARRPREAILVAYVLEFFWVIVPPFLAEHAQ